MVIQVSTITRSTTQRIVSIKTAITKFTQCWLVGWLSGLVVWLVDWLLGGWLVSLLFDWVVGWLCYKLVDWLGSLVCWLVGWVADCLGVGLLEWLGVLLVG